MVGSSKILTVSYGTFSCTLEGFDDPFSTMRSIAEYFRDLAADDRYFGAEPATPDADMLHRIAEREVHRRVETRIKGDGVVLRQVGASDAKRAETTGDKSDAAAAPETAPAAARTPEPDPRGSQISARDANEEPVAADATVPAQAGVEPHAEDDGSVYREVATTEEDATDDSWTDEAEDAAARRVEDAYAEVAEPDAPAEEPAAEAETRAETYAEDDDAYAEAGHIALSTIGAEPEDTALGSDDNSVAAKLSRIRAVVSGGAQDRPATRPGTPFGGSISGAFAGDLGIEDADFEDVAESPVPVVPTFDAGPDQDAEETHERNDLVGESEDGADSVEPSIAAEDAADRPSPGLAAQIVMMKRAATEDAEDENDREIETSSLSEADEAELIAGLAAAEMSDLEADEEEHSGELYSDFRAEDAYEQDEAGSGEEFGDATDDHPFEAEDEDAPSAAFGSATDAAADTFDEEALDALEPAKKHADAMHRHPGFDTARTEEAAFDRILEQTNTRMDDTEGSRRRSAIAHLKAAVAATKADRLLKRMRPDERAAEEQSQYRDDLAKVVQPRRPVTQPRDTPPQVPVDETSAPLVLVSEQRVDTRVDGPEFEEPGSMLRHFDAPRDHDAAMADESGFADFAERMGATDLPDLLEAAAAYTAFVEGNKLFSRPQLMRRVAHVDRDDEFTREAGLRSFGQLLRQGKIQKLKRGQFTIPDDTRFNPQARLAGE